MSQAVRHGAELMPSWRDDAASAFGFLAFLGSRPWHGARYLEPMVRDMLARRAFCFLVLSLLAIAAYWQARATMQLVGIRLLSRQPLVAAAATSSDTGRARGTATTPTYVHATSARAILDRNPFDSVTSRPLDAVELEAGGGAPALVDLEHSESAPACEGLKALLIVSSPMDPAWSMAALSTAGERGTRLVRIGDEIAGRIVGLVEWHRVVLYHGAVVCQLMMFRNDKAGLVAGSALAPPLAASSSPATGGATGVLADIAAKIRRRSSTEFEVDRQVIGKILNNQAELFKIRIVPEQENGIVVGIRLLGIHPESLLGMLGLEDGDRLQSINGFPMANPVSALEAYARLQSADRLTVQVFRRGQPVSIDITIR